MRPADTAEWIDYLSFSAHKIYAPAFSGVLVGPKRVFDNALPLYFGAGMEVTVSPTIVLKDGPERYEGGSNNLLGGIALSCALLSIQRAGMQAIRRQESSLLAYGISRLSRIPSVILYGDSRYIEDRVPIIAFNVRGKKPAESSQYLYDNFGIITKNGKCGANLYVDKLTEGSPYDGLVRVSLAFYNQHCELNRLAEALSRFT
jgi:selenocysteine lyase/cysteine desulfurase